MGVSAHGLSDRKPFFPELACCARPALVFHPGELPKRGPKRPVNAVVSMSAVFV